MKRLPLASSDCELLVQFSRDQTLAAMSMSTGLDKGYISRRMKRISQSAPVLTHLQGKWQLTPVGRRIVDWYQTVSRDQETILAEKRELVIGTTQLLSERKISSLGNRLLSETGFKSLRVLTQLPQIERSLIEGQIDFAVTCAIPQSPEIRFKRLFQFPFVIVTPRSWKKRDLTRASIFKLPHVAHATLDLRTILQLDADYPLPVAQFDHLVGVREAVMSGMGWAVLPKYAVERELAEGRLREVSVEVQVTATENFQLWWVPGRFAADAVQSVFHSIRS